MNELLIQTQDLHYQYGRQKILQGLHLHIPKGSIYGFLGPNGAGKTTTIRLLLGLLQPTRGSIHLFGKELELHRVGGLQRIGTLIETPSLYNHLTGQDNLEVMRRLLGVGKHRIDEVLEIVRLQQDAHRPVKHYSLGMCQRLGIALALLSDPELLILDEPTNGLDPSGIREMRELLISLNQEHGKTIFLSSHLLSEIEKTVTHLSILHQGTLRFEGTVQELHQLEKHGHLLEVEVSNVLSAKEILSVNGCAVELVDAQKVRVKVRNKEAVALVNQLLVQHGIQVTGLLYGQQSLEEMFLSITTQPEPVATETMVRTLLTLS
ncbi:ABC transporter ATP-binding protein [Rufibacter immobilis]|uniref:ABC transporter ATP-binding protein n=1 Tax=Rufibacter immobilis TaxID=1348778 RepID=A0A3M9MQS2_9BACT|nr:ABC transporter ATP-binding protein [Rufibacter immobilis]RNI27860.1 ABC transporter ATP-binding protein [Rufibacter immobilis]